MGAAKRWILWAILFAAWTTVLVTPIPGAPPSAERSAAEYSIAKTIHVLGFATLTFLCGWAGAPARYRWIFVFILMAHSAGTEFIQMHIPTRTGTVQDVCYNTLGIFLGLAVGWKWWTRPDSK